ncbi:hypothetical protein DHB64_00625 [Antarcticibacterium sp. W02-3]|nr:hypothetical protein [Antarcticibacterium sp. W02-3]
MKPTLKFLGLFLCTGILVSCSADPEEVPQLSALEKELQLEHNGVLEIENNTYLFKDAETAKFLGGDLDYSFNYSNELEFELVERTTRHPGADILVKNPASDEYIIFTHIVELSNGGFKFNLEFSNGVIINSVRYFPSKDKTEKWHDVWIIQPDSELTGALIESANTAINADCRAAVNVCNRSGGKALVNYHSGSIWFATAAACEVQCLD